MHNHKYCVATVPEVAFRMLLSLLSTAFLATAVTIACDSTVSCTLLHFNGAVRTAVLVQSSNNEQLRLLAALLHRMAAVKAIQCILLHWTMLMKGSLSFASSFLASAVLHSIIFCYGVYMHQVHASM
jgi:hypothetical protein